MNPQDILDAMNAQYTNNTPNVSRYRALAGDVAQHFRDHKGHAALLAMSLPAAAYGGYRALRKTPEEEADEALHAGPATGPEVDVDRGSDKVAGLFSRGAQPSARKPAWTVAEFERALQKNNPGLRVARSTYDPDVLHAVESHPQHGLIVHGYPASILDEVAQDPKGADSSVFDPYGDKEHYGLSDFRYKIASVRVLSHFGLEKVALTAWQRALDAGGEVADAVRRRMPAGPQTVRQTFQHGSVMPLAAAEALSASNLASAHAAARAMEPLNRALQTGPGYMANGLNAMRKDLRNGGVRRVGLEGLPREVGTHAPTRQWEVRERVPDAWSPRYGKSVDAQSPKMPFEQEMARKYPGATLHRYPDGAFPSAQAKTSAEKVALTPQAVTGTLGALGGAYAGWRGSEGSDTSDRVLRALGGASLGGVAGYGVGRGAAGLYAHMTTPASVPGAQAVYNATRGGSTAAAAAAAPRPGVQPPGVRSGPPVGPPRAQAPAAAASPAPLRANVPPEHQEKFDKIPADRQQAVADHMGWGAPAEAATGAPNVTGEVLSKERTRAALLGIPPTPPGVKPPGVRPAPPVGPPRAVPPAAQSNAVPTLDQARAQADRLGKPYYADSQAMLNDGLMPAFHDRARQAWDTGLVPNTSHDWIMAHNLHSMSPEEHASALAEFAPGDWEHKLLTAMGPRPTRAKAAPTA